jgi:chromosome segregation ATPase
MTSEIIETLDAERTSLDLHVDLCAQRYNQLLNKFDDVEVRFEKIESMLVEIKDTISANKTDNTEKYLKWGGGVIFVLSTALIGLVTHLLFK